MQVLFALVIVVLISALIIDRLLNEKAVLAFRVWAGKAERKIAGKSVQNSLTWANHLSTRLFDAVYGNDWWSLRRLWRSVISTTLALAAVHVIGGWEDSLLIEAIELVRGGNEDNDGKMIIAVSITVCLMVFVPDYLSLQQTRLLMGWADGSRGTMTLFLFVLDLIATAIIFFVGTQLVFAVYGLYFWVAQGRPLDTGNALFEIFSFSYRDVPVFLHEWLKLGMYPLFLSTFFTSFGWVVFVLGYGAVSTARRLSPYASALLLRIEASGRPAQTAAGFVCTFLIVGFVGAWGVGVMASLL